MWEYTGDKRPRFAETPGPSQESVWDYPRPPKLVADHWRIVVQRGDLLIADSRETYDQSGGGSKYAGRRLPRGQTPATLSRFGPSMRGSRLSRRLARSRASMRSC